MTADPPAFRLGDGLPGGVTLLEASAGTGKTHTIASLAVHYLAEGTPVDRLLVVTFTRSATAELRSRVRERLLEAESELHRVLAGGPSRDDDLLTVLASGGLAAVENRRRSLAAALADFDAAMITTIHGFCEQVLVSLGTAADSGRDLHFVEDLTDLVTEVAGDLYLRKYMCDGAAPAFDLKAARTIVAAAVQNRDAEIEPPVDDRDGSEAALRARLARNGKREVLRRARARGLIAYDDQLAWLRDTLAGASGDVARQRMRERFQVVLVDEFQDTDPIQWDIFKEAFAGCGNGPRARPLLLIGDPKQAIYSFRGADVWAYLSAAELADHRYTLSVNWRSDQPLLDALDALLSGHELGHPEIPYRKVTAAPDHRERGLVGEPVPAPLRFRLIHRADGLMEINQSQRTAQAGSARNAVAADLAADVVTLLSSGTLIRERAGAQANPVAPGDIAVLVSTNKEATIVQEALDALGVPAVISGGGSVFATPAVEAWLTLLEALEQPAASTRVKAAALTPFVGWDTRKLVTATSVELDDLQATIHKWAGALSDKGVGALMEAVVTGTGLVERELGCRGGERRLTDIRHVGELLHAEALSLDAGTRALTAWLRARTLEAAGEPFALERSRRLESDALAVQVQTVHRSKGLEFPIVYLPFLWVPPRDNSEIPVYHDSARQYRRAVDVGGASGDDYRAHRNACDEENLGEDLREAYVALTRARHQVVLWWVTGHNFPRSPLARLLFGGAGWSVSTRAASMKLKDDDGVLDRMHELAAGAGGDLISVERATSPTQERWRPPQDTHQNLEAASFDRQLDGEWRRTSYSAITAASIDQETVASETEEPSLADEEPHPQTDDPQAVHPHELDPGGVTRYLESPMSLFPVGAAFGVAVHSVLQRTDFAAEDLPASLLTAIVEAGVAGFDTEALPGALESVIDTPLGPLAHGRRLRDVTTTDRLDELSFELPLAGGDRPIGRLQVEEVAGCLRRWLPTDDPLADYPATLTDPALGQQVLRGYLNGSIDLVLRVAGPAGTTHLVVDYKSNWLGLPGQVLSLWDYRPERLRAAMIAHNYPLQAVLYCVALHRFLRWRMHGYDPELHLGGVLYLFLRGMAGSTTPEVDGFRCGVFSWRPAPGMISELSDLLDAGAGNSRTNR